MKNNEILIRTVIRLLSHHLQIQSDTGDKFVRFIKLIHSLRLSREASVCPEDISFYLNRNVDSRIMAVVEPFSSHEKYREQDQASVEELFLKILASIGLSANNTFITPCLKSGAHDASREKSAVFREQALCEARIVDPAAVLGFGRNLSRILFNRETSLYSRDPVPGPDYPFYLLPGPADVYYDPSLKKDLWNFLRFFRDRHLKNVC